VSKPGAITFFDARAIHWDGTVVQISVLNRRSGEFETRKVGRRKSGKAGRVKVARLKGGNLRLRTLQLRTLRPFRLSAFPPFFVLILTNLG